MLAMPCVVAADGDRDSMPVVVKEAMAMGLPVVASDEVGLPECVFAPWGFLAPPGDAGALAAQLRAALALDRPGAPGGGRAGAGVRAGRRQRRRRDRADGATCCEPRAARRRRRLSGRRGRRGRARASAGSAPRAPAGLHRPACSSWTAGGRIRARRRARRSGHVAGRPGSARRCDRGEEAAPELADEPTSLSIRVPKAGQTGERPATDQSPARAMRLSAGAMRSSPSTARSMPR